MYITILVIFFIPYAALAQKYEVATLAGGCFWCVESDLEKISGVHSVISGYSGGIIKNPTYKQVSSGQTKHIESVQVTFDPKRFLIDNSCNTFGKLLTQPIPVDSLLIEGIGTLLQFFFIIKNKNTLLSNQKNSYKNPNAIKNLLLLL